MKFQCSKKTFSLEGVIFNYIIIMQRKRNAVIFTKTNWFSPPSVEHLYDRLLDCFALSELLHSVGRNGGATVALGRKEFHAAAALHHLVGFLGNGLVKEMLPLSCRGTGCVMAQIVCR